MEQETKTKKKPNLMRTLRWTLLISVVAMLVLYYFSYIFPIPAVEIDATGIPQTKEEYEQWYLKKLIIQNAKVPEIDLEFGEKIISYKDYIHPGIYLFIKSDKTYAFVNQVLYDKSDNHFYKHYVFVVENGEILDFDFSNNDSNEKTIKDGSKLAIFNREKETIYFYNLNGQLISKEYLPKETKYNENILDGLYVNKRFIKSHTFEESNTYFKIPLSSNNFSLIHKRDYGNVVIFHDYHYLFDYNTVTAYGYYMDFLYDDSPTWRKNLEFEFLETPYGFPLLNTSKGLYFFYYYSNERKSGFQKIDDEIIEMNSILDYNDTNIQYINNLKKRDDNYVNVKHIQFRDKFGKAYPYVYKENLIEWNYHIPGKFKWLSSYGDVICTDKGLFTTQLRFSEKDFFKAENVIPEYKIDNYPYYNLFACPNFIYEKIEKLTNINLRNLAMIWVFYPIVLIVLAGYIIIYINKDKHDKKVAEVEYYNQNDKYL